MIAPMPAQGSSAATTHTASRRAIAALFDRDSSGEVADFRRHCHRHSPNRRSTGARHSTGYIHFYGQDRRRDRRVRCLHDVPRGLVELRARLEEAALEEGLEGYRDYAAGVRYRLIPGIW
jgi:hypothetical protein